METNIIIANIIGFIAFTISTIAYHRKKKKNIFIDTLIADILKLIHYIILGAYSGIVTKIMAVIRNITIIKQEKYKFLNSKILLLLFVIAYVIFGILTYQGPISLLSILAALIYTIFCWNGNEDTVRKTVIVSEILWLVYNTYAKSYTGCFYNIVMIRSTSFAIYRNKVDTKIKMT